MLLAKPLSKNRNIPHFTCHQGFLLEQIGKRHPLISEGMCRIRSLGHAQNMKKIRTAYFYLASISNRLKGQNLGVQAFEWKLLFTGIIEHTNVRQITKVFIVVERIAIKLIIFPYKWSIQSVWKWHVFVHTRLRKRSGHWKRHNLECSQLYWGVFVWKAWKRLKLDIN